MVIAQIRNREVANNQFADMELTVTDYGTVRPDGLSFSHNKRSLQMDCSDTELSRSTEAHWFVLR